MIQTLIFSDASVDTQSKTGYGAYLIVTDISQEPEELKAGIKTIRFKNTSSTRLELQTLLWALNEAGISSTPITVYTDSQNIVGLRDRRERFERNNYYSKKNRRLNHWELYRAFFKITDQLTCDVIKVKGHKKSSRKNKTDQVFSLVDKAARKALRGGQ